LFELKKKNRTKIFTNRRHIIYSVVLKRDYDPKFMIWATKNPPKLLIQLKNRFSITLKSETMFI